MNVHGFPPNLLVSFRPNSGEIPRVPTVSGPGVFPLQQTQELLRQIQRELLWGCSSKSGGQILPEL